MSDVRALYQQIIVEHHRRPRNYGPLPPPCRVAEQHNTFCGDRVVVYARVEGERVAAVTFEAVGCALVTASASLMSTAVTGCSLADVRALLAAFHAMIATPPGTAVDAGHLGEVVAVAGVREFPSRIACATLPWDALQLALTVDHP